MIRQISPVFYVRFSDIKILRISQKCPQLFFVLKVKFAILEINENKDRMRFL